MTFMMVYIWFRATFPRFRFDQLMDLGWKWMIPLALGNIFVTGIFILAGQERLMYWIGIAVIGAVIYYLRPKRAAAQHGEIHARGESAAEVRRWLSVLRHVRGP